MINMNTKFEVSSLSRSIDILGDEKFKMGHVTWPRPFQGRFVISVALKEIQAGGCGHVGFYRKYYCASEMVKNCVIRLGKATNLVQIPLLVLALLRSYIFVEAAFRHFRWT